jgi:hypothetical protein
MVLRLTPRARSKSRSDGLRGAWSAWSRIRAHSCSRASSSWVHGQSPPRLRATGQVRSSRCPRQWVSIPVRETLRPASGQRNHALEPMGRVGRGPLLLACPEWASRMRANP